MKRIRLTVAGISAICITWITIGALWITTPTAGEPTTDLAQVPYHSVARAIQRLRATPPYGIGNAQLMNDAAQKLNDIHQRGAVYYSANCSNAGAYTKYRKDGIQTHPVDKLFICPGFYETNPVSQDFMILHEAYHLASKDGGSEQAADRFAKTVTNLSAQTAGFSGDVEKGVGYGF